MTYEPLNPLEIRLHELVAAHAQEHELDVETAFRNLVCIMNSDEVSALNLHNAIMYLDCAPKQEVSYRGFCAILEGCLPNEYDN